jgi:hypothetical protein
LEQPEEYKNSINPLAPDLTDSCDVLETGISIVAANGKLSTLCHSYLKPYCMGRKTAFFLAGI